MDEASASRAGAAHADAGRDHVGISSDCNGMGEARTLGLEDAATCVALFAKLVHRACPDADLRGSPQKTSCVFFARSRSVERRQSPGRKEPGRNRMASRHRDRKSDLELRPPGSVR